VLSAITHQATLSTTALAVGTDSITAEYDGSTVYAISVSPAVSEVVNLAVTTTKLTPPASPATFGQALTFTAAVTSISGSPLGTVTFLDGSNVLGTAALSSSTHLATFSTNTLVLARTLYGVIRRDEHLCRQHIDGSE